MPTVNILTMGTRGVDMRSNPLGLGNQKLHAATNMVFEEGVVRTRPGFRYHDLGIQGQFQGVCAYAPDRGMSAESFGPALSGLVIAAAGKVFVIDTTDGIFSCAPQDLTCDAAPFACRGEVNLFQAENYLVAQCATANTHWWDGEGCMVASPGLADDQYWMDPEPPKVIYTYEQQEAENPGCDAFPCVIPGGNNGSNTSGAFPPTDPNDPVPGGSSTSFSGSSSSSSSSSSSLSSSSSKSSSSSSSSSTSSSSGGSGSGSSASSSGASGSMSASGGSTSSSNPPTPPTSSGGSSSISSSSSASISSSCSYLVDNIEVLSDTEARFRVVNDGTAPLDLISISVTHPFWTYSPLFPVTVAPGGTQWIYIETGSFGAWGATVDLDSNCGTISFSFPA